MVYNGLYRCFEQGHGDGAVKYFRKLAEQGDAEGQFNLGDCYHRGLGIGRDFNEAVKWFRLSANQGYANAQFSLGKCYSLGDGVVRNRDTAKEWFEKAAKQGHSGAADILAMFKK